LRPAKVGVVKKHDKKVEKKEPEKQQEATKK